MKNITMTLASASALLLAPQAKLAIAQTPDAVTHKGVSDTPAYSTPENPWLVDTAVLSYQESGRVSALKPVIGLSKDFGDEHVLSIKLVSDTLTGASPSGAAPANVVQTVTGPSGSGQGYVKPKSSSYIASGDDDDDDDDDHDNDEHDDDHESYSTVLTPAKLSVNTFRDRRTAISLGWAQPWGGNQKLNVGANFSSEYDYLSVGVNGGMSHDLNDKNTTLSWGLALQSDTISPVGGTPVGLGEKSSTQRLGEQSKTVTEGMLGLTQILNTKAFYQLSYSAAQSQGYLTDPYKILTLLDSQYQLIPAAAADEYRYLNEKRPQKRLRHALLNRIKFQLHPDLIVDASHRLTQDDWGVKSQTVDLRLRIDLAQKLYYLEPHFRFYSQTKADFYRPYLVQGQIGSYASADSRLGAFDAKTVGLKWGWNIGPNQEFSLLVDRYEQTPNAPPAPASGSLAGQIMQPGLSAVSTQIAYRFQW